MIRIRTAAIAVAAAASLILAGCGGSSDPLEENGQGGGGQTQTTGSGDADEGFTSESGDTSPSTGEEGTPGKSGTSGETGGESGGETAGGPIIIGSANFTESELIAQIYASALKAQGADVSTKLDIGSREIYLQAMESGEINLLPEYTGGLLAYFDPDSTATAADEVYADLTAALPDDLQALEMSPAQDQDSVTVTKETAEKYNLESIGDLADVAGDMTLGGSSEWQTRADGPKGMKELYGVEFKDYKVLDPGGPLSVKGLTNGLVDATDIFTTNPAIEENDFVVLKDPKSLFQAQNVVPLIAQSVATSDVVDTLNQVSAKLTTEGLTDMLKTISDNKSDPAVVAEKWVADNGLG